MFWKTFRALVFNSSFTDPNEGFRRRAYILAVRLPDLTAAVMREYNKAVICIDKMHGLSYTQTYITHYREQYVVI